MIFIEEETPEKPELATGAPQTANIPPSSD